MTAEDDVTAEEDGPTDEEDGPTEAGDHGVDPRSDSGSRDSTGDRATSLSPTDWEAMLAAFRTRVQEQIAVWPEKVTETIDLVEGRTSDAVPADGEILLYVHGYLGEGRLDGIKISGANQAGALRQALADEYEWSTASPPTVVAATWNSSTIWPRATERALLAGRNLAQWVRTNADGYDRVILVGHSLGARVVLGALDRLDGISVDSAGLFGAAVQPEAVVVQHRQGIESAVEGGVFNYHSRHDAVVCRLYGFREGHEGIGCNGTIVTNDPEIGDVPANYYDVDVSATVRRHMDYFKPLPETTAGNCIRELVERQLEPEPSLDRH